MRPNILNVKPYQETLGGGLCGPASLKMVFDYYGVVKTEKELAQMCPTTKELGTDDKGIKKAAENLGFVVEIKNNSTLEDLQTWLDKKVPVIVDWFTRGRMDDNDSKIADGHYSVVVGLDKKYIYLQDPEIGKIRKMTRSDFMKVWFDFSGEYISPGNVIVRQIIAVYK